MGPVQCTVGVSRSHRLLVASSTCAVHTAHVLYSAGTRYVLLVHAVRLALKRIFKVMTVK
jgi:hypothetical protein